MVLRGEIELEVARVYSGLARTVAQSMSTEVTRARFLAQEPDLSFDELETSDDEETPTQPHEVPEVGHEG